MAYSTRTGRWIGGGTGSSQITSRAMTEYAKQQQQAQRGYQAGLQQLQQTQADATGLYQQAMGAYRNYGNTAIKEAKDLGKQQQAKMQQQMIGSGIASSTVLPSMQKGIMGRTGRTISSILEERANKIAGLQTAQAGATLQSGANVANFMRNQPTADPGIFASMYQSSAADRAWENKMRLQASYYTGSGRSMMPAYLRKFV